MKYTDELIAALEELGDSEDMTSDAAINAVNVMCSIPSLWDQPQTTTNTIPWKEKDALNRIGLNAPTSAATSVT